MKKIVGVFLMVVGFIATLIGTIMLVIVKSNEPPNISIIGGADGPTSIFLAGRLGLPIYGTIIGGIIAFVIGLMILLVRRNKIN